MLARSVIAVLLSITSILAVGTSSAQTVSADVTFEVPLNLTRIHGSIANVKIACRINSNALSRQSSPFDPSWPRLSDPERTRTASTIIPVTQNSAVQSAQVVFSLTDADFESNASGMQATYECKLLAQSANGGWVWFLEARFDPVRAMTPVPAAITGAFVW